MMKKIAIILNAPSLNREIDEEEVIYADAGYRFSEMLKDKISLAVVGDFDTLGKIPEKENAVRLDCEKNYTDGESAVRLAKEYGAEEIAIYGATGGKLEHVLCNIALLKIARDLNMKAVIKEEHFTARLTFGKSEYKVKNGCSVSILPFTDECLVTDSVNLYYPLQNLLLTRGDTRGISNKAVSEKIKFNVVKGLALVIIYE